MKVELKKNLFGIEYFRAWAEPLAVKKHLMENNYIEFYLVNFEIPHLLELNAIQMKDCMDWCAWVNKEYQIQVHLMPESKRAYIIL